MWLLKASMMDSILKQGLQPRLFFISAVIIMASITGCSESLEDGGLRIGWAMEDITPQLPVSLRGQYYERKAEEIQSPLKVTAIAIESTGEDGIAEQAIMVSVDVISIDRSLQDLIRNLVDEQIPEFDIQKLFLNATHTHAAPNPDHESEFGKLLVEKAGIAIVSAWKNRTPAGISRGLGYAVIGHNRRVQYSDGTTQMYGSTKRPDFIGLEGPSDPGVDMLFCWDLNKQLTGIIMNVSCPAQVMEAKYLVSSDYWGEVRKQLKEKYSKDIFVLAQCGAGGDISPRDLPRGYQSGEPNMWDLPGIIEIGKRLVRTVDNVFPLAKSTIQTSIIFEHRVEEIDLPTRKVSLEEYEEALKIIKEIHSREPQNTDDPGTAWNRFLKEIEENEKTKEYGPWDNKLTDFGIIKKKEALVERYLHQENDPFCMIDLHVLRIGDVVIATNPFELYLDYGHRITGLSKAKQTFIVQLCSGSEGYLPTERAILGGGYSAMVNRVGPKGGDHLVNETVNMINSLWEIK